MPSLATKGGRSPAGRKQHGDMKAKNSARSSSGGGTSRSKGAPASGRSGGTDPAAPLRTPRPPPPSLSPSSNPVKGRKQDQQQLPQQQGPPNVGLGKESMPPTAGVRFDTGARSGVTGQRLKRGSNAPSSPLGGSGSGSGSFLPRLSSSQGSMQRRYTSTGRLRRPTSQAKLNQLRQEAVTKVQRWWRQRKYCRNFLEIVREARQKEAERRGAVVRTAKVVLSRFFILLAVKLERRAKLARQQKRKGAAELVHRLLLYRKSFDVFTEKENKRKAHAVQRITENWKSSAAFARVRWRRQNEQIAELLLQEEVIERRDLSRRETVEWKGLLHIGEQERASCVEDQGDWEWDSRVEERAINYAKIAQEQREIHELHMDEALYGARGTSTIATIQRQLSLDASQRGGIFRPAALQNAINVSLHEARLSTRADQSRATAEGGYLFVSEGAEAAKRRTSFGSLRRPVASSSSPKLRQGGGGGGIGLQRQTFADPASWSPRGSVEGSLLVGAGGSPTDKNAKQFPSLVVDGGRGGSQHRKNRVASIVTPAELQRVGSGGGGDLTALGGGGGISRRQSTRWGTELHEQDDLRFLRPERQQTAAPSSADPLRQQSSASFDSSAKPGSEGPSSTATAAANKPSVADHHGQVLHKHGVSAGHLGAEWAEWFCETEYYPKDSTNNEEEGAVGGLTTSVSTTIKSPEETVLRPGGSPVPKKQNFYSNFVGGAASAGVVDTEDIRLEFPVERGLIQEQRRRQRLVDQWRRLFIAMVSMERAERKKLLEI